MELSLQILLCIVALICFLGGMNLLLKGTRSFLPVETPPQPVLDNLFRFLSGIYFSLGFLVAWVVFNFYTAHDLVYIIGVVVIYSGLGRLYSKFKTGSAGKYFEYIMVFEIILGIAIILLQYLR